MGASMKNNFLSGSPIKRDVMKKDFSTLQTLFRQKKGYRTLFFQFWFAYGTYEVRVNDLYIGQAFERRFPCLVMFSVVIDHYDARNNETCYKFFADVFRFLGWDFWILFNHGNYSITYSPSSTRKSPNSYPPTAP